ncbi:Sodium Bile acid symporter family protein [Enhygromyxa salina]|uniref:Sodium Bile acid symporter family protein n=1 Tax=Enhygromyxa salina TaxID=215803 RepID=A0A2S9Y4J8_9BACT|nr:bile acid:sodium symporter [Enhygromyxa salina]PRQ00002.1 Sodium Bile acid symporter family protein [Enhygromyxa salina]
MNPALLQAVGSAGLVVSLMFAIGLELRPTQIAELRTRPAMLTWTVVVNVLVIPGLAWALVRGLALPAEIAVGVLLCAAAPGGPTSALYSNTARADLPLAASMTILLPALGVVATPLCLSIAVELPRGASVPVAPMVGTLMVLQLVPLALGMLIRRRDATIAARLSPYASAVANAILGLLVITLLVIEGELFLTISAATWAAILTTTLAALALGYLAAGAGGVPSARAGALVASCRNVAVALMLASTFFRDPVVNATVLAFGFVAFVIPLGIALWWRLRAPEPTRSL